MQLLDGETDIGVYEKFPKFYLLSLSQNLENGLFLKQFLEFWAFLVDIQLSSIG